VGFACLKSVTVYFNFYAELNSSLLHFVPRSLDDNLEAPYFIKWRVAFLFSFVESDGCFSLLYWLGSWSLYPLLPQPSTGNSGARRPLIRNLCYQSSTCCIYFCNLSFYFICFPSWRQTILKITGEYRTWALSWAVPYVKEGRLFGTLPLPLESSHLLICVACARHILYLPPHLPPSISMPALGACGLVKVQSNDFSHIYFFRDCSSFTFPDADFCCLCTYACFT